MSYNISSWKTKKLIDFRVHYNALYSVGDDKSRRGWRPDDAIVIWNGERMKVKIGIGEMGIIKGSIEYGWIHVTDFKLQGEASGTFWRDLIKPALMTSRGEMEAVLIWEDGNEIERVTVRDGQITEEAVEL